MRRAVAEVGAHPPPDTGPGRLALSEVRPRGSAGERQACGAGLGVQPGTLCPAGADLHPIGA